jgi:SlyX protein
LAVRLFKNRQIRDILEVIDISKGCVVDEQINQLMDRLEKCEIALAHAVKVSDELSDVVAAQETKILVMQRRLEMLMTREAEREAQGVEYVADQRPPHW